MREEPPESKRIKLEVGATSPASSHQSMKSDWSMEPPGNSSGGNPPLMPSMKQEPSVASCPESVKREQPHSGATPPDRVNSEKAASPGSSCLSMKSDWSMDPPQNFRGGNSPIMPSLLTEDHFRCSVCTEVLKDPVSIPCGHSYCRQCITSYWAQPNHAGVYACPQCSHTYICWPAFYSNSTLAEVVKKLQHFSPALPAQCYAGAGDVCCDFCTEQTLRAVKSCLNCMASYCESHVRQHYTVPVLQRHTLVEPENQEGKDKKQHHIKTEHFRQDTNQAKDQEDEDRQNYPTATTIKLYGGVTMLLKEMNGLLEQQMQKLQDLCKVSRKRELQKDLMKLKQQWEKHCREWKTKVQQLKEDKEMQRNLIQNFNHMTKRRGQLWQGLWDTVSQSDPETILETIEPHLPHQPQ